MESTTPSARVFLSWSCQDPRSKGLARALKSFLDSVLTRGECWYSDHDIAAGARWRREIEGSLRESDYFIACTTPFNADAIWMVYEAGLFEGFTDDPSTSATDKEMGNLCRYLLTGQQGAVDRGAAPLDDRQAVTATFEGTWQLVISIESVMRSQSASETESDTALRKRFEDHWEALEHRIADLSQLECRPWSEIHRLSRYYICDWEYGDEYCAAVIYLEAVDDEHRIFGQRWSITGEHFQRYLIQGVRTDNRLDLQSIQPHDERGLVVQSTLIADQFASTLSGYEIRPMGLSTLDVPPQGSLFLPDHVSDVWAQSVEYHSFRPGPQAKIPKAISAEIARAENNRQALHAILRS